MSALREFRCTRRAPYRNPNCPGHKDVTARQGYYIEAHSALLAGVEMRVSFPHDIDGFDIEDVTERRAPSRIRRIA